MHIYAIVQEFETGIVPNNKYSLFLVFNNIFLIVKKFWSYFDRRRNPSFLLIE